MTDWPWLEVPSDEQRTIRFIKAFHRCTDPKGNFGIGGVRMQWVLKVGDWAIAWDAFIDQGLSSEDFAAAAPGCTHPSHKDGHPTTGRPAISGGAVDWHSPVPMYEGHLMSQEACQFNGTACFMDSGFILADDIVDVLAREGDEGVWRELRRLLDKARD